MAGTLIYLSSTPENGKNGQVGKEEILANNVAMNLRERVKGSLLNRDTLRLDTAVALLPQVEDARAFGEREEGVVSVSLWVLFALWNDRV